MIQEILSLIEEHENFRVRNRRTAGSFWKDFNECFTNIQWKSVRLLPATDTDFSIWLWKKGFQTERDFFKRRESIEISNFTTLSRTFERLRNADFQSISGLSREARRRLTDIAPKLPQVPSSLTTTKRSIRVTLPGRLLSRKREDYVETTIYCRITEGSYSIGLGSPFYDLLSTKLRLVSVACLIEQCGHGNAMLRLLQDVLEVRRQQIQDLEIFEEKFRDCLGSYLVFHQV